MQRLFLAVLIGGLLSAAAVAPDGARAATNAAGEAAFARGDFARAEAEWKPAAENGDPDAEFGLGEVYEQAKGDYPTAELWYGKAAVQDNAKAKYRLMLIYMAGNKQFPPDLAKAYGWMLLAADDRGQPPAFAELRSQLEAHLGEQARADGRKFAEAWKAAHAAPTPPPAVAAPSTPTPPAAPNPVQPVVVPPPAAPNPRAELDEALKGVDCAPIQVDSAGGVLKVSGSVPDEQIRTKLLTIATRAPADQRPEIDVAVIPPPLCRSVTQIANFPHDGLANANGIKLTLLGDKVLTEGQPIQVEIQSQVEFPVILRVDYFTLDDQVLHMWPNQFTPTTQVAAGETRRFLHRKPEGADRDWLVGSAPFGTELIVAVATPRPLNLGNRPPSEAATAYLRDLTAALRQARATGQQTLVATTYIHTAPR